ncbi:hypothetical protein [Paludibacterium denitrificans]|uniref:hypothetical protein n=1 Tax=Paludibacterium denitrificans TaxID=2675226 RepID=UPI001E5AF5B9|nr:hypothetical protein [Paludibacterium denitrificans]
MLKPGDIAMRAMPYLTTHWRVLALCHHAAAARRARLGGAVPVSANLDDANSLRRLAGLADDVLITAPPPNHGVTDPRTRKLLYALTKGLRIPQRVSYISTSGVYGNADGNWLDETAPTNPGSDRARRRWMRNTPCVPLPSPPVRKSASCAHPAFTPPSVCRSAAC